MDQFEDESEEDGSVDVPNHMIKEVYRAEIRKLNKAIERKNRGIKNLRNTIKTMERLGYFKTKGGASYDANE